MCVCLCVCVCVCVFVFPYSVSCLHSICLRTVYVYKDAVLYNRENRKKDREREGMSDRKIGRHKGVEKNRNSDRKQARNNGTHYR